MRILFTLIFAIFLTTFSSAQYSITGTGSGNTYTQDFDAFRGTAATLPSNWVVATASYNTTYPIVTAGSSTPSTSQANGNNCYAGRASTSSSDYSILQKQATSGSTSFTFSGVNNTASILDGFVIAWNVEQFTLAGRATTVDFTYRINAATYGSTGITGTTLFTAPTGTTAPAFILTSTPRSITITGLSIPASATVDFRFTIANGAGSGNNAHIGIDDFTLYATSAAVIAPSITSALTASGTCGNPFNYTITATNSPTSYNAINLPAGLSVNTSTGAITGSPTATGIFNVDITATNAAGSDTKTLVLTINPTISFAVSSDNISENGGSYVLTLNGCGTGTYGVNVSVTGGTAPLSDYTFVSPTTVSFSGSGIQVINIPIVNNAVVDGNRTITFGLSSFTGSAVVGSNASFSLTIVDDEIPAPVITHTAIPNTTSTSAQVGTASVTNSPSSVIVTYRRNGGGWGTVNATLVSGTNYTFTIPGMPQGSTVQYYITATNSGGTDLKPSPTTYYSYTVGCAPPAAGTKIIAFQGFEFPETGYTGISVPNQSATPTGLQNYLPHPSLVEMNYYLRGTNGDQFPANRNSCGCMAETFVTGPPPSAFYDNGVNGALNSGTICRNFSGSQRGVYKVGSGPSTDNPTNAGATGFTRNGSYAYVQQSRNDGGDGPISKIYFDAIQIPDYANATNVKIRVYVSSISTNMSSNNGADAEDFVRAFARYGATAASTTIVNDVTSSSDWFNASSNSQVTTTVTGTLSNSERWDYLGNMYNTSGTVTGTTTKNMIELSIPAGNEYVRLMIDILNDDGANNELWAIDDIQIIADYTTTASAATITSQPSDIVCGSGASSFTVAATGTALTYLWYYNDGIASPWTAAVDGANFTGSTATTLNILNTATFAGYKFYCAVTESASCTISTATVQLYKNQVILNSATLTAVNKCDNSDGFTYYEDPTQPNKYIFAIKWAPDGTLSTANALTKAAATATITIDPAGYTKQEDAVNNTANYSMSRYWNVNAMGNSIDEPVNVRFYFTDAEYSAMDADKIAFINANPSMRFDAGKLWFKTVGVNFDPATHISAAAITGSPKQLMGTTLFQDGVKYVEFAGVTSFSGGTAATGVRPMPGLTVLPVQLITFNGTIGNDNKVYLKWKVASELNMRSYIVEKSIDGKLFTAFKEVTALNTSNGNTDYQAIDNNFTGNAVAYYRLQMVNIDGSVSFSNIIVFKNGKSVQQSIEIAPNPANDFIQVKGIGAGTNYQITNAFGELILSGVGTSLIEVIDIGKFEKGIYFIKSVDKKVNKFVKM
ncbi:putative Ig domain-containing protein [Candidatus Brachybacter algidus]|uniref:putative Ig domain-containing protein n=1 Tax=Candidatus Brachybacter algidus TaxID=2982024 RepID=UPI001D1D7F51|nr:putative Ig domain-containing protein [Candidatus Brachybacter algidus]MBK6450177.1 putative Ig domain-containing protein [Candidatus Brachybacter algidus]